MTNEQIISELKSLDKDNLFNAAIQFLCLTFGFNNGLAVVINRAESKHFCLIRRPDGKVETTQSRFDPEMLELPNWGAFGTPKVISVMEDFNTQSILTRQCRKFLNTQELMDEITANVAKTPSVFVPLHDKHNEPIGFFHAFWERRAKAEKPTEFGRRDEVLLTLFKNVVEMTLADQEREKILESSKLQSFHLEQNNKKMEKELTDLRKDYSKRMEESHMLGMSDVAAGVLHNIGNVMNSVSVSTTMISTNISNLKVELLKRVAMLLAEHKGRLDDFTQNDEVGRDLIEFADKIASDFALKKNVLEKEVSSLANHLEHVKSLISSQQAATRLGGIVDAYELSNIVEEAVRMCVPNREEEEITVIFDFEPVPLVVVDKHKLLQILVNLFSNARNSLLVCGKKRKQIDVSILRIGSDRVQIRVKDNGIGIPPQNLGWIFTQGFSTKKDGNGIGLHTCQIAAQEMKGKIWCESGGVDLGATFFVELPMTNSSTN